MISSIPVTAFANVAEESTALTLQVAEATGKAGTTVEVKINLSNNPGLASLAFDVSYDEYLILTGVAFNSAFGSYVAAEKMRRAVIPILRQSA